jgi:hypothetical protein
MQFTSQHPALQPNRGPCTSTPKVSPTLPESAASARLRCLHWLGTSKAGASYNLFACRHL